MDIDSYLKMHKDVNPGAYKIIKLEDVHSWKEEIAKLKAENESWADGCDELNKQVMSRNDRIAKLEDRAIQAERERDESRQEIESLRAERDFYKEDRDRCERLERGAFESLQKAERERDEARQKVESLQAQLNSKVMFVANGMEEEQYALQERLIEARQANAALLEGLRWIRTQSSRIDSFTEALINQYDTAQPTAPECKCNITGPILCPSCEGEEQSE